MTRIISSFGILKKKVTYGLRTHLVPGRQYPRQATAYMKLRTFIQTWFKCILFKIFKLVIILFSYKNLYNELFDFIIDSQNGKIKVIALAKKRNLSRIKKDCK